MQSHKMLIVYFQNLFSTNAHMPDIQGYLQLKDLKRSSSTGHRHFFVLRHSGLYYSTRGASKEPRHLVLLSDLADVNIYSAGGKKSAICLLSGRGSGKLLVAGDEHTKICWMVGMRLVKVSPIRKWKNGSGEEFTFIVKKNYKLLQLDEKCWVFLDRNLVVRWRSLLSFRKTT